MMLKIIITLTIFLSCLTSEATALNRSRPFHPRSKSVLTGFVTIGNIVGDRARNLDAKDQYVYGLGLGTEHYPHPSFGLGVELRQQWFSRNNSGSTIYTIFSIFRFAPNARKSVYLKIGTGSASSNYNSRTQVKIALGLLSYNSRRFNSNSGRIELSFNRQPDRSGLNYLALEFGLGLPLF